MINQKLINPKSIVICGASTDEHKPGGKLLVNLLNSNFKGDIYLVNPKEDEIRGIKCYHTVEELPQVDCAIMAIAAKFCPHTVDVLAHQKGTGGFIIVSAGFSEENAEGAKLEKEIVDHINSVGGSLIGPNLLNRVKKDEGWTTHFATGAYTSCPNKKFRCPITFILK